MSRYKLAFGLLFVLLAALPSAAGAGIIEEAEPALLKHAADQQTALDEQVTSISEAPDSEIVCTFGLVIAEAVPQTAVSPAQLRGQGSAQCTDISTTTPGPLPVTLTPSFEKFDPLEGVSGEFVALLPVEGEFSCGQMFIARCLGNRSLESESDPTGWYRLRLELEADGIPTLTMYSPPVPVVIVDPV